MSIRDALGAVPAKPIILTVVLFTAVAAAWHGWTLKTVCTHRAELTASLQGWASAALQRRAANAALATATNFEWDEVRIAHPKEIDPRSQNCPFDWHWSNEKLSALAKSGNLTLFGFVKDGSIVEIVDFDRENAQFDVTTKPISRESAVFRASGRAKLGKTVP